MRLLALCNISTWPTIAPWDSFPAKQPRYYAPFVHALNVTDFVLDGGGGGVIDGQGACWWEANCDPAKDPACRHDLLPYERPRLVVAEGSRRVLLARPALLRSWAHLQAPLHAPFQTRMSLSVC